MQAHLQVQVTIISMLAVDRITGSSPAEDTALGMRFWPWIQHVAYTGRFEVSTLRTAALPVLVHSLLSHASAAILLTKGYEMDEECSVKSRSMTAQVVMAQQACAAGCLATCVACILACCVVHMPMICR